VLPAGGDDESSDSFRGPMPHATMANALASMVVVIVNNSGNWHFYHLKRKSSSTTSSRLITSCSIYTSGANHICHVGRSIHVGRSSSRIVELDLVRPS
jgi:hypothetical protein